MFAVTTPIVMMIPFIIFYFLIVTRLIVMFAVTTPIVMDDSLHHLLWCWLPTAIVTSIDVVAPALSSSTSLC
jgi:hypothetical protein